MPNYAGLDGRAITKTAREAIQKAGLTMDLTAEWDQYPDSYRANVRREQTSVVNQERQAARDALNVWAETAAADARARFNKASVGSAAEESRRVAEELRINRMIDSARAGGNVRSVAMDLQDRASAAMADGNPDEAMVLARTAVELDPQRAGLAAELVQNIQLDRDLADPDRAKALRDLKDINVVVAAFDRDVSAQTSLALQQGAKLAKVVGDHAAVMDLNRQASVESMRAKVTAFGQSQANGDGKYVEPVGVLPGGPTGEVGGKFPGTQA
jgi:hypothetical protein